MLRWQALTKGTNLTTQTVPFTFDPSEDFHGECFLSLNPNFCRSAHKQGVEYRIDVSISFGQ